MNQSDRTLAYHLGQVWDILRVPLMGGVGGTRQQEEYDPNQQAEQVELRCPICGRSNCPLDVRRGM